jgi:hypothetical protein
MASWPIVLHGLATFVDVRSIYGILYDHCWVLLWVYFHASSHVWAIWPPCASCFFLLWLLHTHLREAVLFHKAPPQQYHYDTSTNCTSFRLSGFFLLTRPAVVWHRCHEGGRWWVRMTTRRAHRLHRSQRGCSRASGVYKTLGLAKPLSSSAPLACPLARTQPHRKLTQRPLWGRGQVTHLGLECWA